MTTPAATPQRLAWLTLRRLRGEPIIYTRGDLVIELVAVTTRPDGIQLDAGDAMGRLLMASPYATIAALPDAQRAIDVLAALASHARCVDLALGWDALASPERLVALLASA